MHITTKWNINNMTHNDADGGVVLVYWSCTAQNQIGTNELGSPVYGSESAVEAGKLRLEPNPLSPDFVPYDQLTEETVLGWVYNSLIEGEETAEEAKIRIEENHMGKVEAQIAKKNSQSSGMPWVVKEVVEEAA